MTDHRFGIMTLNGVTIALLAREANERGAFATEAALRRRLNILLENGRG